MDEIPDTRSSLLVRLRKPHNEQAWSEFVGIYEPLVYQLAGQRGLQDADAREEPQRRMKELGEIESRGPETL